VQSYLEGGGRVLALGDPGTNLTAERRQALLSHPSITTAPASSFSTETIPTGPQVRVTGGGATNAATTLQAIARGAALHLIRYDEVGETRAPLGSLELEVRIPFPVSSCEVVDPLGEAKLEWETDGSVVRLRIRDVPLYAIVVFAR
jgi:hypothetical protein